MTSGRGTVGAASPSRVWTETRGRAAAAMGVVFTKLGFKGLGFETLNINIFTCPGPSMFGLIVSMK